MTSPSRTNIALLPRGHEFSQATFEVSAANVAAYLTAVQDESGVYGEAVPPLAVAAAALRALLEQLELPAGTLHTAQEVECLAAVPAGAGLTMAGRLAQRSERGGFVASVIEFEVTLEGSRAEPVLRGRATVMAPQAEEG
jgi:hypothetical protein